MLHAKYFGSRAYGFTEDEISTYVSIENPSTTRAGPFLPLSDNLNKSSRGPLGYTTVQILTLGPIVSEKKIFFKDFRIFLPSDCHVNQSFAWNNTR